MGYRKPGLEEAQQAIRRCLGEIHSPYNDGYISMGCKHDLYVLKSWLEEEYARLPKFSDEKEWEQERLISKLRQEESKP